MTSVKIPHPIPNPTATSQKYDPVSAAASLIGIANNAHRERTTTEQAVRAVLVAQPTAAAVNAAAEVCEYVGHKAADRFDYHQKQNYGHTDPQEQALDSVYRALGWDRP
jgi:hypothetical protein